MDAGMSQREDDARAFYDGLGADYDLMVSWESRLEREKSFLGKICADAGARSVLDAACGTGMHAIAFARAGLECAGADLSAAMVEKARQNAAAAGVQVRFETAGLGELATRVGNGFDAATCLGNSLPHLLDDASLASALADFAALLRPRGLLVIQNRNYDRLLQQKQRFMPPASREDESGETIYLRITDFYGEQETVGFTIVTLRKKEGAWSQSVQTTTLRALRRATVEKALAAAGFSAVTIMGGFDRSPYDAPGVADLVALAVK